MTKDEDNAPPLNINEGQIESEIEGAPSKTPKKVHFKVYHEIISAFLKNEALTETELADDCGYADKGKDKISYINRQLNKLVSKLKYVEQVPSSAEFRIKRDLDVIGSIYNNKKFTAIRSDFSTSTWLMHLIVKEHMPEFSGDVEFIEDLKKMVGTSSSMFNFFLREKVNLPINPNLGTIIGPTIPVVKTPGINLALIESFTRKSIVYDMFITCMCLDHDVALMLKTLPDESLQIFDEMKQKSAQSKLKAINYIQSFTTIRSLAQCADATQTNEGKVPLFFEDIVKNYNAITERLNQNNADRESLKTTIREMSETYNRIRDSLDASSTIDRRSGQIVKMGPLSLHHARETVLKKSDAGKEKN
jgi:hypothetical protein